MKKTSCFIYGLSIAALLAASGPADAQDSISQPPIVINEIMARNIDVCLDPSFNYGSFVELYNPTDTNFTLIGLYLSDNPTDLKQHKLSALTGIITPKGYKTLWFEHYSKYFPTMTDYKLSPLGGTLYISDADGNILAEQEYPALPRISYARTEDYTGEFRMTWTPTPNESNQGSIFADEMLDPPTVDVNGRVFTDAFYVHASAPQGAMISYTLDGSVPTLENGTVIESGNLTLNVNATTVLRMRSFRDGMLPSEVVTRSYINRGYDSDVAVISVVTDNANIYSTAYGIYVKGPNGRPGNGQSDNCNWNQDWDRPVNFELLVDDTVMAINQMVDMAICGGWSRSDGVKSFKLKADKKYNPLLNYLPYTFFDCKKYNKNKVIQNRNGGNESGMIIDAALQEIVRTSGLDIDCQAYRPAVHYINGKAKGVINIREPNNKKFVEANYGYDSDEIDMFEMSADSAFTIMCGDDVAYKKLYSLSKQAKVDSVYQQIKQLLDIEEYINYMCVELYLGNWDWPQNNLKGWRPRTEDGKFRFVLFDLEQSFNTYDTFNLFAGKKKYTFSQRYDTNMTSKTEEIKFVTIFLNLLKNSEFKQTFIDRFCIIAGSVFDPVRCRSLINSMAAAIYTDMVSNGNYNSNSSANSTIGALSDRASNMLESLAAYTTFGLYTKTPFKVTLSSDIDGAGIVANGFEIPTGKFSGKIYNALEITAHGPAGYDFAGWYDANGNLLSSEKTYTVSKASTLIASYTEKATEELDGTPLVRINEVSAANSIYANEYYKREDCLELYNPSDIAMDVAGMYLSNDPSDPLKYRIPAGLETTIEPHGFLVVWCDKLTPINQVHTTFKLSKEGGSVILTSQDESWRDILTYEAHNGTESVGLYPDGGNATYKMYRTTMGRSNVLTYYAVLLDDGIPDFVEPVLIEIPANDTLYDLSGRIVTAPVSGNIYIKDGKKYLFK